MFIAALFIHFKAGKQLWCPSEVAYGDTCLPHKLLRQDKWAVDIPWLNIIQNQRETTKPQGTWRKAQSTLLKEGWGLYVVTSVINQSKPSDRGDSGERQRTPGESTGFQGAEIDSADDRCPLAHSGVDHDAYTSLEQGSPCNLLSTVPRISHKALLLLSLTCVWSVAWPAWEKIQL